MFPVTFVRLGLLLVVSAIASVESVPNYCPTTYRVRVERYRQVSYDCSRYHYCGWWWGHHWCRTQRTCYTRSCYHAYEQRINPYTCCAGWKGSRCDIPICNPPCKNNALCVSPNNCYCLPGSAGATCDIRICSATTDCYPGTCASASCSCTAGFSGSNCAKILDGPDFRRCSVTLFDLNGGAQSASCGPPGTPEEHTFYTNKRDVKSVEIDMETVYTYPGDIPFKPPYMPSSEVGNVESYAIGTLRRENGVVAGQVRMNCDDRVSPATPFAAAECKNRSHTWTHAIAHDYRLEFNMYGASGGYKDIINPSTYQVDKRFYISTTNNQTVLFIFDILSPTHCHEDLSDNCTANTSPLLTREHTMVPNISMVCTGWSDKGTDLWSYKYEIFNMGLNSEGNLELSGNAIFTKTVPLLGLTTPEVSYVLPKPGRYSAVLTVADRAGNTKKARSLILFDNSKQIAVRAGKTIRLAGDVEGPYHRWLTNFNKGAPTEMTALLGGVFYNQYHVNQSFLVASEVMPKEWGYEDTFGNLTTDPIRHVDGIIGFEFAFGVDQSGGESTINNPPELKQVYPFATESRFSRNLNDKDSVVLMVKAYDAVGDSVSQTVVVHLDSSAPVVTSATFTKDVNATDQEQTPYASKLGVLAIDAESGIAEVAYEVFEETGRLIGKGITNNFRLNKTLTCPDGYYEITLNECYPRELPVAINNCLFMRHLKQRLRITYSVKNSALLETAGRENVTIGPLNSVYGLNEYPSGRSFQALNISHKHVELVWRYPNSCYTPTGAIVTIGNSKHHVEYPQNNFLVRDLEAETSHKFGLLIKYEVQNSGPTSLSVTTSKSPCLGKGCSKSGLGAGGIVGIVIAMLLAICIAALVVLIIIRKRANKPAMPDGIRHMGNTIRNRMSRHGGNHNLHDNQPQNNYVAGAKVVCARNNPAYGIEQHRQTRGAMNVAYMPGLQGNDDDIYIYGDMETDPNATWKHSDDQVIPGAVISSGRFAEIRKATLNNKDMVVAKMLKAGASAEDRLLMKAKMNFLATSVPPHENIVNLVGAVPLDNPVILLEFCELTLKDWLKNTIKVTENAEDEMIQFSIQIARAMTHLSENHIVHRRLGVRNILLKDVNGRHIAKVTGFGPMAAELEESNAERERIPMKWMAPEQIGGKKGERRIYNDKTDVWTYGVTLWEIFSKGGSPYKEYKHGQLEDLHKSGFRLPKPDHGPTDMYKDVMLKCWAKKPKDRPTFADLLSNLERQFGGAAGDAYYYDETTKPMASGGFKSGSNSLYE